MLENRNLKPQTRERFGDVAVYINVDSRLELDKPIEFDIKFWNKPKLPRNKPTQG